jgi:hypothetical protein
MACIARFGAGHSLGGLEHADTRVGVSVYVGEKSMPSKCRMACRESLASSPFLLPLQVVSKQTESMCIPNPDEHPNHNRTRISNVLGSHRADGGEIKAHARLQYKKTLVKYNKNVLFAYQL